MIGRAYVEWIHISVCDEHDLGMSPQAGAEMPANNFGGSVLTWKDCYSSMRFMLFLTGLIW